MSQLNFFFISILCLYVFSDHTECMIEYENVKFAYLSELDGPFDWHVSANTFWWASFSVLSHVRLSWWQLRQESISRQSFQSRWGSWFHRNYHQSPLHRNSSSPWWRISIKVWLDSDWGRLLFSCKIQLFEKVLDSKKREASKSSYCLLLYFSHCWFNTGH